MQCNVHCGMQCSASQVTQDAAQCALPLHRGIRPRQLFFSGALFSDFAGNLFLRRALIRHLFMLGLGCMGSGGNFAQGGGRSGDKGGQRRRQPMSGRLGPKKGKLCTDRQRGDIHLPHRYSQMLYFDFGHTIKQNGCR